MKPSLLAWLRATALPSYLAGKEDEICASYLSTAKEKGKVALPSLYSRTGKVEFFINPNWPHCPFCGGSGLVYAPAPIPSFGDLGYRCLPCNGTGAKIEAVA